MKKFLFALSVALVAVSCGPSRHSIHVEMRHPSKSGVDLGGKVVSIVYLENENSLASSFAEGVADGFAYALEQDYATGEGSVGIFRMRYSDGGRYSDKDTLVNLLIDTGADVVFLLDTLALGELTLGGISSVASPSSADSSYITLGNLPFKMNLYCFDGMDKDERVYTFSGSSVAAPHAYSDGRQSREVLRARAIESLPEVGFEAGAMVAGSFKSQWKHEQYSVVYFDSSQWYKAVDYAEQYYWKEAMDIWMQLLDTNDLLKRSCAEYNISVACYMLGDYDLSLQWLDRSDADNKLPLSDALRKRIEARK